MAGTPFRELFIVEPYDLGGELAVSAIEPGAVDAQNLHVDPALVERVDPVRTHEIPAARPRFGVGRERRVLDDVRHFRNDAVRMDVDHLDALAADGNFAPIHRSGRSRLRGLKGWAGERILRQHHSGRRTSDGRQEFPATAHGSLRSCESLSMAALRYAAE